MKFFIRLLIILSLCYVGFLVFVEAKSMYNSEQPDPTKIIVAFLALTAIGITAGFLAATTLLPAFGEAVGKFFFSSNQQVEKSPHAAAVAKMARGDYEGAVEAYKKVLEKNPADTHAVSEAARLLCDKLNRPEDAATFLEGVLQGEWSMDNLAFLANRLVDVYWNYLKDIERARPILEQIVEDMPETKHSANAAHRLRDIDIASQELPDLNQSTESV